MTITIALIELYPTIIIAFNHFQKKYIFAYISTISLLYLSNL